MAKRKQPNVPGTNDAAAAPLAADGGQTADGVGVEVETFLTVPGTQQFDPWNLYELKEGTSRVGFLWVQPLDSRYTNLLYHWAIRDGYHPLGPVKISFTTKVDTFSRFKETVTNDTTVGNGQYVVSLTGARMRVIDIP